MAWAQAACLQECATLKKRAGATALRSRHLLATDLFCTPGRSQASRKKKVDGARQTNNVSAVVGVAGA